LLYSDYRDGNKKRLDYLEWPEYFMAIAFLSAQRSKDPATQVDNNNIAHSYASLLADTVYIYNCQ